MRAVVCVVASPTIAPPAEPATAGDLGSLWLETMHTCSIHPTTVALVLDRGSTELERVPREVTVASTEVERRCMRERIALMIGHLVVKSRAGVKLNEVRYGELNTMRGSGTGWIRISKEAGWATR